MDEQSRHSEELFEVLNRNKKKRRRKVVRTVLTAVVAVAVIGIFGVVHMRNQVRERFGTAAVQVEHYTVTMGTIHTVVTGTGTLTQVDLEDITVPTGVEITQVLVENQEQVRKGDLLATVEPASVLTALADIQSRLDELDDQITDAKADTVSSYIRAGVAGRVKEIYAQPQMDVTACMARHGALAVLSLDGYMAVDVETDKLSKGQSVTVLQSDGESLTGLVDTAAGGTATILVTDDGPKNGQSVTVLAADGTQLGSGSLYIHSPLAVTGYAGTVSGVAVQENARVYTSSTLFHLTNTSFSASYDALLRQRGELEETLMQLLTIYRDGAVLAPWDGMVSQILFDEDGEAGQTDILTLFPNERMSITVSVDETDILSLEEGQTADVLVSSVSEETITGTVTGVSREAVTSSGVTTYSAQVEIPVSEGMLPGMTAEVDIRIQGVEDALIIPVDALHRTSSTYYVYTAYDPETQQYGGMVQVSVGMQNDDYVEILSGIEEGSTIYYVESRDSWFGFPMGGNMSSRPSGGAMPSGSGQRPGMVGGEVGGRR